MEPSQNTPASTKDEVQATEMRPGPSNRGEHEMLSGAMRLSRSGHRTDSSLGLLVRRCLAWMYKTRPWFVFFAPLLGDFSVPFTEGGGTSSVPALV